MTLKHKSTIEVGDTARISLTGVRWTVTDLISQGNGRTLAKLLNPATGQRRQTWSDNLVILEKDQPKKPFVNPVLKATPENLNEHPHTKYIVAILEAVANGEEVYIYDPKSDTNRQVLFS